MCCTCCDSDVVDLWCGKEKEEEWRTGSMAGGEEREEADDEAEGILLSGRTRKLDIRSNQEVKYKRKNRKRIIEIRIDTLPVYIPPLRVRLISKARGRSFPGGLRDRAL